jgi:hypothetical protein
MQYKNWVFCTQCGMDVPAELAIYNDCGCCKFCSPTCQDEYKEELEKNK